MLKEHLLKYIELKPKVGYYELNMTFGLPIEDLLKLLDISKYKIKDTYLHIYDANGNVTYYENSNGGWGKYEYDTNGNEIYIEYSNGFWEKWEYDVNGKKTYYENSNDFKETY